MQAREKPISFRIPLLIFIVIAGLVLLTLGFHRYHYPKGMRSGKLTTFAGVLDLYAQEHDGWYPKDGATSLASLQKLYPKYCAAALAGMSGNEEKTVDCLKSGKTIDESVSSWVYFPGFCRDDDSQIAILWERKEGIFINGSRANGHAVAFAGGGYNQISDSEWPSFLKQQEQLRKKVLQRNRDQ